MYIVLAILVLIWLFVMFLDIIFKSCMFHPYYIGLSEAGLDIQPFFIGLRITRFNRFLNRMGLYRPSFLKTWFHVGAVITSVIIFPCLLMYVFKLLSLLITYITEEFENSRIISVIPGYNFLLSHWKLYCCVLLLCSIFHELGHALAASRIGVSIDSIGFTVWFVAPMAFVNLRFDQLRYSSRWEQLCVFCAGIWHNIVLSLSCFLTLKCLVFIISPLFYIGGGVSVLHVNEQSGLNHPVSGLTAGDIIYALGNCAVKDLDSWNACLEEIDAESEGLCVPKLFLFKAKDSKAQRCGEKPGHLYFDVELKQFKVGTCLHGRTAINKYRFCKHSLECKKTSLCVQPRLSDFRKFVVIKRNGTELPSILYEGTVKELKKNEY